MKKKNLFLPAMVIGALGAGCSDDGGINVSGPSSFDGSFGNTMVTASGTMVTQERSVSGFNAVAIGVPGRLVIEHGAGASSLTITGDENVLSVITSDVRDGALTIALAANTDLRLNDPLEIEYRVTVEKLRRLDVNGVVHVVAGDIATAQFDVRINGASIVTVSGTCESQNVFVSGTSRYQARDLVSRDADIDVSGAAFALVNVRENP